MGYKKPPCIKMQSGLELVTGLEPATCALRMRCTTNCATQAYIFNIRIILHLFGFVKALFVDFMELVKVLIYSEKICIYLLLKLF